MKDRLDEIRSTASPTLREDQIEVLMRYGERRKTVAGQVLSRAGDASYDFVVVLEGSLEVLDDFAGEARIIVTQRAGGFVGELNMLTGQARYISVVVREGGEVLAIPLERLKEVVTEEPNLSDIILKALRAQEPDQRRTRPGYRPDGRRTPRTNLRPGRNRDGARGPRRDGLRGLALELIALGGQAGTSSRIENYLGFPWVSRASSSPVAPWSRPTSSAPAPRWSA
jgi:hypothetical protein